MVDSYTSEIISPKHFLLYVALVMVFYHRNTKGTDTVIKMALETMQITHLVLFL